MGYCIFALGPPGSSVSNARKLIPTVVVLPKVNFFGGKTGNLLLTVRYAVLVLAEGCFMLDDKKQSSSELASRSVG